MSTQIKNLDYYLSLPYTIELIQEGTDGWFAAIRELPGCMTMGDTQEKALEMLRDAQTGWLELALEDGVTIPEPTSTQDFSGKFVTRVPRSLHRRISEAAAEDGVSLNQFVNVALATAVGMHAQKSK